jgi:hypothetical protein
VIVPETEIIQAGAESEACQIAKSAAVKMHESTAHGALVAVTPMNPVTIEQQLRMATLRASGVELEEYNLLNSVAWV